MEELKLAFPAPSVSLSDIRRKYALDRALDQLAA